jgi:predicted nucleotidyltransferase
MKKYCGICDDATYKGLCDLFRIHQVARAMVFGSFARGEPSRRSDVDLLLVQETTARYFDRYDTFYAEVSTLLKPHAVDLVIYTEDELDTLSSRKFIQKIMEEGVVIYESKAAAS